MLKDLVLSGLASITMIASIQAQPIAEGLVKMSAVNVAVTFDDDFPVEIRNQGFTEIALSNDLELRCQMAGLKIKPYQADIVPQLQLDVSTLSMDEGYVFSLRLRLLDYVFGSHEKDFTYYAPAYIYSLNGFGVAPPNDADYIKTAGVSNLVTQFLNDWLKANPK